MKLGMLARSEHRGLGTMTKDFYDHMHPDRTLLVIPEGVKRARLISHREWYPDAMTMIYGGALGERRVREWLDGLDVVYTAETFYDWRICAWAREQGVATVCHLMPEWWRRQWANGPNRPTAWWAPTTWLLEHLPENTTVVPVPIAGEKFADVHRRNRERFRWLHVAGAPTTADRNGTRAVLNAAQLLEGEQEVLVRCQIPGTVPQHKNERLLIDEVEVLDTADLYRDADAFVMPRRYAGLCLPVLEAIGAGLPVVMTDLSPQNTDWPVEVVRTKPNGSVKMMPGLIATPAVDIDHLVEVMTRWATDPTEVEYWRLASKDYATANDWSVRAPQIRAELERVVEGVRRGG